MAIRYSAFLLSIVLSVPAYADDDGKSATVDITPESAYFKVNVFNLADKGDSFLRIVGILGTEVIIVPDRVSGILELHIGPTRATFNEGIGEDLSLKSTWASNTIVSMLAGGRLILFRRSYMEVGTSLKFESSIFSQNMGPESFAFTNDGNEYDVSGYAKDHTSVSVGWSRWIVGFDVRVPLGMCTPYLALGFEKHEFTVDLNIDKDGKDLIRSLGENPSSVAKTYDAEYFVPTVGLGADLDMPNLPIDITAGVVLIPVSIEKLFLSASIGVALEL